MNFKAIRTIIYLLILSVGVSAQTQRPPLTAEESLEFIAVDLQKISETIQSLNKEIVAAYGKLSSSMGLSLTENQQKILVTFEVLNRAEQRLANLQKLRFDLIEKQTDVNAKIAVVENNLRIESLDRNVALIGTTNAEELRDNRRRVLDIEKRDLKDLLSEIQFTLSQTNSELRQTNQLVDRIRGTLFPAIYQELPKLDYDFDRP